MTNGHVDRWAALIEAANAREWDRMRAYLADGATLHEATHGLGSTTVRFDGADAIVEGHRAAAEGMGLHWEVVSSTEAQDMLTALVINRFGNGRQGLAAAVVRFDEQDLIREVYSYNKRPA